MKYNLILTGLIIYFFLLFIIIGLSLELFFISWIFYSLFLLVRLYSHLRFILLILELLTLTSLILIIFLTLKSGLELRFLFLFLCFAVGEAALGLRLLVITSRFQSTELISLNIYYSK